MSPALILLLVLGALSAYRSWIIVHNQLPLFMDEAQYWLWSRDLAWGYYSKPPMVAWVIRLCSVLGDSELAIRAGSLLLHAGTGLLVYALGRTLFTAGTALGASLLFISLPLVGFNSLFMTTDAPLLFFWAAASFFLWRALTRNAWPDWLWTGIAAGLGLLSKYSMVIFAVSVALALCLPVFRHHRRNPALYLAALLALLIFLPNVMWNVHTDFVSFRHTAEISHLDQNLFHPARLGEFLLGQFACMGPLAFAALLAALGRRATWQDPRLGFLAALTLPFLGLIGLQALLARANLNWAAPAYIGGSLLVAACWLQAGRTRRLLWAVLLNLLLLSAFYHYHALARAAGVSLTRTSDPYARLLGWPEMGEAVHEVMRQHPDAKLVVLGRSEFALLSYYARPLAQPMRIWHPSGKPRNHFHLVADVGQDIGANVIFAAPSPLGTEYAHAFHSWTALGSREVQLYPHDGLRLYLYRGEDFRGYGP